MFVTTTSPLKNTLIGYMYSELTHLITILCILCENRLSWNLKNIHNIFNFKHVQWNIKRQYLYFTQRYVSRLIRTVIIMKLSISYSHIILVLTQYYTDSVVPGIVINSRYKRLRLDLAIASVALPGENESVNLKLLQAKHLVKMNKNILTNIAIVLHHMSAYRL